MLLLHFLFKRKNETTIYSSTKSKDGATFNFGDVYSSVTALVQTSIAQDLFPKCRLQFLHIHVSLLD